MKTRTTFFMAAFLFTAVSLWPQVAVDGKLPGKFTINANGDQVYFSQGNLQYQAINKDGGSTWRFAEKQTTFLDRGPNKAISETNTGWIDLFGWGTANNPTNASTDNADYSTTFSEWGDNAISNGGNKTEMWRTLKAEEWMYIFHERAKADELVGFGTIGYSKGVILLPDDWQAPVNSAGIPLPFYSVKDKNFSWLTTYYYNSAKDNYSHNDNYSDEEWGAMEAAGAVFLPVTGLRIGTEMDYVNNTGGYHSATLKDDTHAYCVSFSQTNLHPNSYGSLYSGYAVRLVQDCDKGQVTAIDEVESQKREVESPQKVLCNGQLLIIHNGKTFNALGAEVK